MEDFYQKYKKLQFSRSSFCVGVDPTTEIFSQWKLESTEDGLTKFCNTILKAADGCVSIFKPQIAYFERFGPGGLKVLQNFVEGAHEQGSLVIVDAKRGDIGSSAKAYGFTYLGPKSVYKCDAMTVNAYLGFNSLNDIYDHAHNCGAMVFLVVRSSNLEGDKIQNAKIIENETVASHLASEIYKYNEKYSYGDCGPLGAVLGATQDDCTRLSEIASNALYLCPGVGKQGATVNDLKTVFQTRSSRAIPTSSRAILEMGPDIDVLKTTISAHIAAAHSLG